MSGTGGGLLRDFVAQIEAGGGLVDGSLSLDYGFLPRTLPRERLPAAYGVWDEVADRLPELNTRACAREELVRLPQLDASDEAVLPDVDLPRASTVLSQLALAWWRGEPERFFAVRMSSVDADLPDAIRVPWLQVTRRLGRGEEPYQSGYDLFLNNFRLRSGSTTPRYDLAELRIENLETLVPSFANQPERVFYMVFVEMMAHCAPMIRMLCELETCMGEGSPRPARAAELLAELAQIVKKCSVAFMKVAPKEGLKTWCDPLLWAKTVAIFAVPIHPWRQGGTSGAFVPLFLTLDELIGRSSYGSYYGEYVRGHAPGLLPPELLEFNRHVGALDLRGWIDRHRDEVGFEQVVHAYDELIEAYAGQEGYLGRHVSKVLNYLAVATMVGRNQSTSGDERFTHEHTWMHVAHHLNAARDERYRLRFNPVVPTERAPVQRGGPSTERYISELEVARSCLSERPLHILHDGVYDLNDFARRHVGGADIIRCYGGLDATSFFALAVEHGRASVQKQMEKYRVGRVGERLDGEAASAGEERSRTGELLRLSIYCRNIMQRHRVSLRLEEVATESGSRVSPSAREAQRRLFVRHAHQQFVLEHLPALAATSGHEWAVDEVMRATAGNFAVLDDDDELLEADVALLEAMIVECLRCVESEAVARLGSLVAAASHLHPVAC